MNEDTRITETDVDPETRGEETEVDTQPRFRRLFAGAGLFGALLLFLGSLAMFGFMQIIPGLMMFGGAVALGASSAGTLFVKPPPEDDPQENEPIPNPPPAPKHRPAQAHR